MFLKLFHKFIGILLIAGVLVVLGLEWFITDTVFAEMASSEDYELSIALISSGGGEATSADYILYGTLTQTAIGECSSSNYRIYSGYIYAAEIGSIEIEWKGIY